MVKDSLRNPEASCFVTNPQNASVFRLTIRQAMTTVAVIACLLVVIKWYTTVAGTLFASLLFREGVSASSLSPGQTVQIIADQDVAEFGNFIPVSRKELYDLETREHGKLSVSQGRLALVVLDSGDSDDSVHRPVAIKLLKSSNPGALVVIPREFLVEK